MLLLPYLLVDFVFPSLYRVKNHAEQPGSEKIDNFQLYHPVIRSYSPLENYIFTLAVNSQTQNRGQNTNKLKKVYTKLVEALSGHVTVKEQPNPPINIGVTAFLVRLANVEL
jgi:hypothetical protein